MYSLKKSSFLAILLLALSLKASSDLVEVSSVNADIRYAATRSYPHIGCHLRPEVAQALSDVQNELAKKGYGLKLYDAYIPYSESKKSIEGDDSITDPEECLRHSRGIAVDVALITADGTDLPMPTEFDDFSPKARPDYMDLSEDVIKYRDMLKTAMERYGFKGSSNIWFHFEYIERQASESLDVSFEDIK